MERVDKILRKNAGIISEKVGIGLVAGLSGTVGMTAAQMIEMNISGRQMSSTPATAVEKIFGFKPAGESSDVRKKHEQQLANIVHWLYGTSWGVSRGLLSSVKITGWKATAIQFTALWGTGMVLLPLLKVAPPVKTWGAKEIAKDAMFHAVYALVAGIVFDKLNSVKK